MAQHIPSASQNDGAHATRCRRCGILIGMGEHCDFCQQRPTGYVDAPGEYMGRHHTEWIPTLDQLLLQGDTDAAEFLLVRLVDATESESLLAGVPAVRAALQPARSDRPVPWRHHPQPGTASPVQGVQPSRGHPAPRSRVGGRTRRRDARGATAATAR